MRVDRTEFGSITIDGSTYEHDVVIRLSGEIVKRKKKLSSRKYGTSHKLSRKEARFIYEDGCKQLIIGTGQYNNLVLSKKAQALFDEKQCKVIVKSTPDAIKAFNAARTQKKIGLFHITC